MPFDAGQPPPQALSSEPDELPIDRFDWGMRIIVFGTLMVLWLAWVGTSIWNAIMQGWRLGGGS